MTETLSTRLRNIAKESILPMSRRTQALLLAAAEIEELRAFGLPPEDFERHKAAIIQRMEAEIVH